MNERIKLLAEQAGIEFDDFPSGPETIYYLKVSDFEKFAELIVRECIKQAHSVGDLRGTNDDMVYGADTAAVQISRHFGVEE